MATHVSPLWNLISENTSAAGGTAEFYKAGTSTAKNYYDKDGAAQGTSASLTTDGTVSAGAYGIGNYKIIIKDENGNVIDTYDNLLQGVSEGWVIDVADLYGTYDYDAIYDAIQDESGNSVVFLLKENPSGNWSITDNLTFESTHKVIMPPAAIMSITAGKTMTFNHPDNSDISLDQHFTGSGTATFNGGEGYPEWWGALGDDSNDDTAATQSCLDSGLERIIFSPGMIYLLDAVNISSDTTIIVRGTCKSKDGDVDMFTCNAAISNVAILGEGGKLDGNQAGAGTSRGIYLFHASGISDIEVAGLEVTDWLTDGIAIYDATTVSIHDNYVHDNTENNIKCEALVANASNYDVSNNRCVTTTNQNNIFFFAAATFTLTDFVCNNNVCIDAGDIGIEVSLRCANGTVAGNTVKDSNSTNILVRGANKITVTGNTCIGSGLGIYAWEDTGDPASADITITGNTVFDADDDGTNGGGIKTSKVDKVMISGNQVSTSEIGIRVIEGSFVDVVGNQVHTSDKDGILIQDTDGFSVVGNSSWNNDQLSAGGNISGIRLVKSTTSPTDGLVSNNRVFDTGGATQTNGINYINCTNTAITNNKCWGHTAGQNITSSGTNTNSFRKGNQINTNALTGSVTLDADASTTVSNNNITSTSKITITPTNAAAATLQAGASAVYVTNRTSETSFDLDTADAGNAAGTETFEYTID
jgi:hypothetical protein